MNKIAIFFDAENTPSTNVPKIISFLSSKGDIIFQRAYADWSMPNMKEWQSLIDKTPAITSVQQFHHNKIKNAVDYRIVMEASEMLVKNDDINTFVLVTYDSGFYYLVRHLRENGKQVFVVGEKAKKCKPDLREVCNAFYYVEDLPTENKDSDSSSQDDESSNIEKSNVENTPLTKEQLVEAIKQVQQKEHGGKNEYVLLAQVGAELKKQGCVNLHKRLREKIEKEFSGEFDFIPPSKKKEAKIRLKK